MFFFGIGQKKWRLVVGKLQDVECWCLCVCRWVDLSVFRFTPKLFYIWKRNTNNNTFWLLTHLRLYLSVGLSIRASKASSFNALLWHCYAHSACRTGVAKPYERLRVKVHAKNSPSWKSIV